MNFRKRCALIIFCSLLVEFCSCLHPTSKYWIWNAYCQWSSEYIVINYCFGLMFIWSQIHNHFTTFFQIIGKFIPISVWNGRNYACNKQISELQWNAMCSQQTVWDWAVKHISAPVRRYKLQKCWMSPDNLVFQILLVVVLNNTYMHDRLKKRWWFASTIWHKCPIAVCCLGELSNRWDRHIFRFLCECQFHWTWDMKA